MMKRDHSRERVFTAPEPNGGELYTTPPYPTLGIAHGDLRLEAPEEQLLC